MLTRFILFAFLAHTAISAHAQAAVIANPAHADMLRSADPRLAANKKLVYDFWREVLEARHVELAEKYVAADYVQHNPNIATGRQAMVDFFAGKPPKEIAPAVVRPLVAISAEGDLVTLAFVQQGTDPRDPARKYTTTWFDMFRVANGQIVEHWDSAIKN